MKVSSPMHSQSGTQKENSMNRSIHLARTLAKGTVVAALAVSALLPGLAYANPPPPVPVVPANSNLQVGDGSTPYLLGHATGTQNYICQAQGTSFAWTFVAPKATLYSDLN